jgi:hypothetical protein
MVDGDEQQDVIIRAFGLETEIRPIFRRQI